MSASTYTSKTFTKPATPSQINLIIHGNVLLEVLPDKSILANIADFGTEHIYRAGYWLGELTLHSGNYELTGVAGGTADFDQTKNMILKPLVRSRRARPYATIKLPRPVSIASIKQTKLTVASDLQGADVAHIRPGCINGGIVNLATVQILTYNRIAGRVPLLDDHDWAQDSPLTANLHIFAEPDFNPDPALHSTADDFAGGLELFRKPVGGSAPHRLDLKPKTPLGGFVFDPPNQAVLSAMGIFCDPDVDETEDLFTRTRRMARIAKNFRDTGNLIWDSGGIIAGAPQEACTQPLLDQNP